MPDPYQILGVSRSSTAAEIKSAYRKLAKKLHPDVNPGRKDIEQKFKEITAAYDLLSDADKRARFDRGDIDAQGQERGFGGGRQSYSAGTQGFGGGGFGGFGGGRKASADPFSAFGGMEDIFAEFMGGAARGKQRSYGGESAGARTSNVRGSDVTYTAAIPFALACLGGKHRVTMTNDKTLEVGIPAGVEDGHKLRLKGQGLAGIGGGAGDAIIELRIEPTEQFTRKGRDVYQDIAISLPEAVLGAAGVTVPTLDGQVAVKVPKGANTDTLLRLKGKGVGGTNPGDMFVKLKIVLPDPLPPDLAEMVEKWAKKHSYNPRKG